MKRALLLLLASVAIANGQTELTQALVVKRVELAAGVNSDAVNVVFAKETVLQIIPLARQAGITIKPDAAQAIVTYLTSEGITAQLNGANKPPQNEQVANRKRYALALLSRADIEANRLVLNANAVNKFHQDIKDNVLGWFCPCWPFCR